jgi:hypothetical protein
MPNHVFSICHGSVAPHCVRMCSFEMSRVGAGATLINDAEPNAVRLLAAQMPFDFARKLLGEFEYITFFRNPIMRTVYYYVRQDRRNPAWPAAQRLSLTGFVEGNYASSNNCYTRWLSTAAFGTVFGSDTAMLEAALRNLSPFSFVDITEAFELSVHRLCRRYKLFPNGMTAPHQNCATPATLSLPRRKSLSSSVIIGSISRFITKLAGWFSNRGGFRHSVRCHSRWRKRQ